MKTKAVRIYGEKDLRLETFELPELQDDEILVHVISDSLCMSSYKAAIQGSKHKRVPDNIATNPTIIGHEFSGVIEKVGKKWQSDFKVGQKFSIQPAHNYKGTLDAPGYSYEFMGGDSTYCIIRNEMMEMGCLLPYEGDAYFYGSLAEPMSCIVGAFHANYHIEQGTYNHSMGIVEGGNMAILAGAGPMGLGAIDYAIHNNRKPGILVVTDINQDRLDRAEKLITPEEAAKHGVELHYVNTGKTEDPYEELFNISPDGYNDVMVFAPVKPVVEMGDKLLAKDGCLNFFAGPTDTEFSALLNFYNVHYKATHIVGTSGGNTDDMKESLEMMEKGIVNPSSMITHVGGLDSVVETTLNLPKIKGGKKLVYNNIKMPMTAINDFEELGKNNKMYKKLAELVKANNGLWSLECEQYLLANAEEI